MDIALFDVCRKAYPCLDRSVIIYPCTLRECRKHQKVNSVHRSNILYSEKNVSLYFREKRLFSIMLRNLNLMSLSIALLTFSAHGGLKQRGVSSMINDITRNICRIAKMLVPAVTRQNLPFISHNPCFDGNGRMTWFQDFYVIADKTGLRNVVWRAILMFSHPHFINVPSFRTPALWRSIVSLRWGKLNADRNHLILNDNISQFTRGVVFWWNTMLCN